jgi:GTPase SAR1 family protein
LPHAGKTALIHALLSSSSVSSSVCVTVTTGTGGGGPVPASPSPRRAHKFTPSMPLPPSTPVRSMLPARSPFSSPTAAPFLDFSGPSTPGPSLPSSASVLSGQVDGVSVLHGPSACLGVHPFSLGAQEYRLIDLPGPPALRPDWARFVHVADFIVFVVDATEADTWALAQRELTMLLRLVRHCASSVPVLVACNKHDAGQDLATPVDVMASAMRLHHLQYQPLTVQPTSVMHCGAWRQTLAAFLND